MAWIGVHIGMGLTDFVVTLPEAFCREVIEVTTQMLDSDAVCARKLRSLAGKLSWAGSYIVCFATFLQPVWAALSDVFARGAQHNDNGWPMVGVVRIAHALRWIRSFCRRQRGTVERRFPVAVAQPCTLWVICDASPYGYGGILVDNGQPVAYLTKR